MTISLKFRWRDGINYTFQNLGYRKYKAKLILHNSNTSSNSSTLSYQRKAAKVFWRSCCSCWRSKHLQTCNKKAKHLITLRLQVLQLQYANTEVIPLAWNIHFFATISAETSENSEAVLQKVSAHMTHLFRFGVSGAVNLGLNNLAVKLGDITGTAFRIAFRGTLSFCLSD